MSFVSIVEPTSSELSQQECVACKVRFKCLASQNLHLHFKNCGMKILMMLDCSESIVAQ